MGKFFYLFKKKATVFQIPSSDERGTPVQGYFGYKKTLARGSVGLRLLKIRKPSENRVGPISLGLRKRTKAVGPRFIKVKKTQGEAGRCS